MLGILSSEKKEKRNHYGVCCLLAQPSDTASDAQGLYEGHHPQSALRATARVQGVLPSMLLPPASGYHQGSSQCWQ